jgi:hypothetical protein
MKKRDFSKANRVAAAILLQELEDFFAETGITQQAFMRFSCDSNHILWVARIKASEGENFTAHRASRIRDAMAAYRAHVSSLGPQSNNGMNRPYRVSEHDTDSAAPKIMAIDYHAERDAIARRADEVASARAAHVQQCLDAERASMKPKPAGFERATRGGGGSFGADGYAFIERMTR